jgi:3-methylcrotonyl-CoA carboxylase alpha subunit
VREGDAISPHYDSMIAKLIVWGEDRAQALARLDAALRDTHIVGLHTNVAFLRRVVGTPGLCHRRPGHRADRARARGAVQAPPLALECAAAGVVALALADERAQETPTPGAAATAGACMAGRAGSFDLQQGGEPHTVAMTRLHDGATALQIGAQRWPFTATPLGGGAHDVRAGRRRLHLTVYARMASASRSSRARAARCSPNRPIAHAGDGAAEGAG